MLEGLIVFNLSGSVKNSSIPNLVAGDKNSVKLKVKWLAHESLPVFANLTNYVVEGVYTRPDGKVSPALTFSIDNENDETKYLIFGSWLTEIAGIATLTVRFKQNDEIKATGQISLFIQDGSTPADVVITEPQHEALQESIQAEENARKQAILGLQNELEEKEQAINNSIEFLNSEIEKETNARVEAIRNEREDRENSDLDLNDRIDYTDNRVDNIADSMRSMNNQLQNVSTMAEVAAAKAYGNEDTIKTKLNKIFDVSDANDIAEEDYFVINSGGNAYRITLSQLKEKLGNEGETVVNNYLGDFNSEQELKATYPVAQEGNFAYVKGEDEIYAMYLWVDEDDKSGWYKSTSGKYVKTTTFDSFKEQLASDETGAFVKSAKGYSDNETFIEFINAFKAIWDRFEDINVSYTNANPTPQALGGIPKGTTFINKPITEVLDMLLYPYVPFSVDITTSPNGGTFEKGTSKTISSCTVNITKGSTSITKITVKHGTSIIATKTSNIGTSNSITFGSITITSSTSVKYLTAIVEDETGASKSDTSGAFTFVDPYYYGVTTKDASSITASDITSMTKDIRSKGSKSYTFTMGQQRAVIAYPASYGALSSVKDSQNNDNLSLFTRTTLTINGVSYYVYVTTKSQTNTISLTFNH